MKIEIDKEKIIEAIFNTKSMGEASIYLNISWRSFKRIAIEYGLYKPSNQGLKKYLIEDILNGKHPQYPTSKLSKRLVSEGYFEYKCVECGINEYNGKPISLELNHIDGKNSNNLLSNLELLCPNCHSQTPTYRSKKLLLKK